MTRRHILTIFLLVVATAFAACASDDVVENDGGAGNPAAKLERTFDAMTRLIELDNSFSFMDHVSEFYVPSKSVLKMDIDDGLGEYLGYTFFVTSRRINVEAEHGTLIVEWRRNRTKRESGEHEMVDGMTELQFTMEDGRWMLVQQNGDQLFGK